MSTTEDHQEVQVYELGYLVLPSVTEDNIPTVVSNLVSIITKGGAKPLDSEDPFLNDLEYSMSKTIGARKYVVDEAYIGWMKFEAEPQQVEAIKKSVDAVEEILRSLLIKAPRETTFTFAKAREALEAAQAPAEAVSDVVAPEIAPEAAVPEVVVE